MQVGDVNQDVVVKTELLQFRLPVTAEIVESIVVEEAKDAIIEQTDVAGQDSAISDLAYAD